MLCLIQSNNLGCNASPDTTTIVKRLYPGDILLLCTDGVIKKFDSIVTAIPPVERMRREQLNLEAFVWSLRGDTLEQKVDALLTEATMRYSVHNEDDIAIVAAQIKP